MTFNEQTDLATLAGTVKKKVNGLLGIYSLLILGTIVLFLVVTAVVLLLEWAMVSGGTIYVRAVVLGLMVIGAAGYCLVIVLKPVFRIFERTERKGVEIKRKDYPELFTLIDEIVKEVDCLDPKHVRILNECNAYVYYPSLMGYIKSGRQNLTIGLPLICMMNKTELKSILAHEFGHFTQRSVSTNRIANLSEFICASIARAENEIDQKDDQSVARWARGFARLAGKIMANQYHKIAPYNGVLSRAQEFDADHFSQLVAGTEGSIGALCKLDWVSDRWRDYYSILANFQKTKEWAPDDVLRVFSTFSKRTDDQTGMVVAPDRHIFTPVERLSSRISSADKDDTHPSIEERLRAIRSYPEVVTVWDDSPALDYLEEAIVHKVFDGTTDEIQKLVYPGSVIFLKKKLTAEEMERRLDDSSPGYIDNFGKYHLFFTEETDMSGDTDTHPEYVTNPFTRENSRILEEFYIAEDDLMTLRQVSEEASPKTRFCYLGEIHDGTNPPVAEHEAYFAPLKEKAVAIARHCNWWLDRKAEALGGVWPAVLRDYRIAASADLSLRSLNDPMRTIYSFYQAGHPSEGGMQYISKVEEAFRQRSSAVMQERQDGSIFDSIASQDGVDKQDAEQVRAFFRGEAKGADNLLRAYITLGNGTCTFSDSKWEAIERTLIFDRKETDADKPAGA